MRVFQHSVMQRNVTQRKSIYATKSVAYFFTQPQTPQRRLRLLAAALRKQIETTSIFFRNARAELHQSELRLRSTNGCGTLRCVALRNAVKRALDVNASSFSRRCRSYRVQLRWGAAPYRRFIIRTAIEMLLKLFFITEYY